MQKRGLLSIFALFTILVLTLSFAIAQDSDSQDANQEQEEVSNEEVPDAELRGAGITPDSAFYFFESGILEKFRDDLGNVEKKASEIRAMIQAGKIEEARIALQRFNQFADELEKEINPDKQEEAKRVASAIRQAIREIESEIPEEDKQEFVDDIIDKTDRIETAAEIAGKIKELCEALAKVDPDQYSRTGKTSDDSPKWQKDLDKDLTDEQKKDTRIFIEVMSQCFKDATQCQCGKIPVKAFADQCAEVAPLYVQCQQGDESKCEEADELSEGIEDTLPDYLQSVLADLEDEFEGGKFENHLPEPCREAGATDRKSCMRVMILQGDENGDGPPPECREALISALDSGVTSDRELRDICEKIMFQQNAPQECITAGLTDHRECGRFMFQQNAPQECIDAGLTGESPRDGNKCREIMDGLRGQEGEFGSGPNRGPGPGFNTDCRRIENSEERLKCFDGAVSFAHEEREEFGNFEERFKQDSESMKQCANSCLSQGRPWFFKDGNCECGEARENQEFRNDFRPPQEFNRDSQQGPPPGISDEERKRFEEERARFEQERQQFQNQPPPQDQQQPPTSPPPSDSSDTTEEHKEEVSSSDSSSSGSEGSGSSGGEAPVTGNAITGNIILNPDSSGNGFLSYFFGKKKP